MTDHIPLEDLSARIDDELTPARRDQVDAHLAACTECREQLEGLRWSVALTRAMPKAQLPPGASLRVPVADVEAPVWRRMLDGGVLAWAGAAAVAAVAVVALGIAAFVAQDTVTSRISGQDEQMAMMVEMAEEAPEAEMAAEQGAAVAEGAADSSAADEPEPPAAVAGSAQAGVVSSGDAAASVGTADLEIGHPLPLASARAADERDRGFFPPAEMVIEQPAPDTTALALAARSLREEVADEMPALAAPPGDGSASGPLADEAAPGYGDAVSGAIDEDSAADDEDRAATYRGALAAREGSDAEGEAYEADEDAAAEEIADEDAAEMADEEAPLPPPEIGGAVRGGEPAETVDVVRTEEMAKSRSREAGDAEAVGSTWVEADADVAANGADETLDDAFGGREGTDQVTRRSALDSRSLPIVPMAALAVVLLALSALLYVRARR